MATSAQIRAQPLLHETRSLLHRQESSPLLRSSAGHVLTCAMPLHKPATRKGSCTTNGTPLDWPWLSPCADEVHEDQDESASLQHRWPAGGEVSSAGAALNRILALTRSCAQSLF